MQIYEVGGSVRDSLLGIENKDHDFTVVIPELVGKPASEGYEAMATYLFQQGYTIFLENPDVLTVRSKFPKDHVHKNMVADFVLARREEYVPGNRRPSVVVGSLHDDLMRRDFTVNALARNETGTIIDECGGILDLKNKILRTPLPTMQTFTDDPLRALRAVRFSITKGFTIHHDILKAFRNPELVELTKQTVSADRIREELTKTFKHDTMATLRLFEIIPLPLITCWLTAGNMWLKPTFEK